MAFLSISRFACSVQSWIQVDSDVKKVFEDMKTNQKYPWAIFRIAPSNDRVVVETKGKTGQGFTEFQQALEASGEPRYALFDAPRDWSREKNSQKLCFVFW